MTVHYFYVTLTLTMAMLATAGCGSDQSSSQQTDRLRTTEAGWLTTPTTLAWATDAATPEADWGDLTGTFVYDGDPSERTKLAITKDKEFCGKFDLLDESVVVNKTNRGLANVALYLYLKRGDKAPAAHPSYASAEEKVLLDNQGCRFSPRVCLATTSQTLVIGNSDEVGHNTKIDMLANASSNETIAAGSSIERKFNQVERSPGSVSCSIHPWMRGYVLIRDNPYFAVTDENGQFTIKDLPPGKWTFQVWHEKARITEVTLGVKKTKWTRGRAEITINGGKTTDLGKIKVSPGLFK